MKWILLICGNIFYKCSIFFFLLIRLRSFMNRKKRLKVLGYRKLRMQKIIINNRLDLVMVTFQTTSYLREKYLSSLFSRSDKSIPLLNNVVIVIGQRTVTKESSSFIKMTYSKGVVKHMCMNTIKNNLRKIRSGMKVSFCFTS